MMVYLGQFGAILKYTGIYGAVAQAVSLKAPVSQPNWLVMADKFLPESKSWSFQLNPLSNCENHLFMLSP